MDGSKFSLVSKKFLGMRNITLYSVFLCGSMIVHKVYHDTSCTIMDPGLIFLCGSMIIHQVYHDTSCTILDPRFILFCGSMMVHQVYRDTSCTILDPGFIFLCGSMIVHQVYNCTSCTILDPGFIFLCGSTIVHWSTMTPHIQWVWLSLVSYFRLGQVSQGQIRFVKFSSVQVR